GAWGMALAYATACRGGCHLKAWTIGDEVVAPKYDRFSVGGKAKLVVDLQNLRAVEDSFGVCVMGRKAIGEKELVRILAVTTGWNVSVDGLLTAGERIYNLERVIAVRDGVSRKDDILPQRIVEGASPNLRSRIGGENFDGMLDEYYSLRGWDENGKPTCEKLEELGLPDLLSV
ncbi:MAG TPA: aldehyde ferredoxin oxidoreductase, partial [Hadesarchaea archaeon]|nr:aldehyde ferredoxin oxidoreductase [Hadesarchaea archaeon]